MMNKYFLRLSIHLIAYCSILIGQKIVNMNGTYDLDGDNMLEFVALELNPNKDIFPKLVRYYEIDADGYQTIMWEFIPPVALEGDFVDAKVGDLNGDGFKDLVLQTDGAGRWSSGPHKYHPYIFFNDGDNVYLPPLKETIPIDKYQIGNTEFYSLGDINGDGNGDLFYQDSSNDFYIALNSDFM